MALILCNQGPGSARFQSSTVRGFLARLCRTFVPAGVPMFPDFCLSSLEVIMSLMEGFLMPFILFFYRNICFSYFEQDLSTNFLPSLRLLNKIIQTKYTQQTFVIGAKSKSDSISHKESLPDLMPTVLCRSCCQRGEGLKKDASILSYSQHIVFFSLTKLVCLSTMRKFKSSRIPKEGHQSTIASPAIGKYK